MTSGQGVLVGNLFGVVAKTAAEGESVEIATIGVYELPKLASAVIAAGDPVAWDNTAKEVNEPDTVAIPSGSRSKRRAMAWRRCACGWTAWRLQRRKRDAGDDLRT